MEKNVAHENAGYTPDLVCLCHFCTQLHVTDLVPSWPTMHLSSMYASSILITSCLGHVYSLQCKSSAIVFSLRASIIGGWEPVESPVEEREGVWRRARFSRLRDVVPAAIGRARCCAWNLAGPGVRCSRRSAKCISLALSRTVKGRKWVFFWWWDISLPCTILAQQI